MKAERLLLTMIVAIAIFATPSVLTSPVLAQGTTDTAEGTTDTTDGNQGTTGGAADDESPEEMYDDFQSCLEDAEGAEAFATEDEIRTCFIDAGYIQGTDDDSEEEDEDGEEETN